MLLACVGGTRTSFERQTVGEGRPAREHAEPPEAAAPKGATAGQAGRRADTPIPHQAHQAGRSSGGREGSGDAKAVRQVWATSSMNPEQTDRISQRWYGSRARARRVNTRRTRRAERSHTHNEGAPAAPWERLGAAAEEGARRFSWDARRRRHSSPHRRPRARARRGVLSSCAAGRAERPERSHPWGRSRRRPSSCRAPRRS